MQIESAQQRRIDDALATLGQLTGGAPYTLELSPSPDVLDATVTAENSWAQGLLYETVSEYLGQLAKNLAAMSSETVARLAAATTRRLVRFRIDPSRGGLVTAASEVRDGVLELVFRAQSLKTNHGGWTEIGHDLTDVLSRGHAESPVDDTGTPASSKEPDVAATATGDEGRIEQALADLMAFVGDGRPWRVQLDGDAAEMDAAVTREASYMAGRLFETVADFLALIVSNIRRTTAPAVLADASPMRTIKFRFVEIDDCPRQYKGAFQAVVGDGTLAFIGPAGDFKSNGAGAATIGEDVERALRVSRGESGMTDREQRIADSLAALAQLKSSDSSTRPGRVCRVCKGTRRNVCTGCHGKGGSCNRCRGTGRSQAACFSCGGTGEA